MSGEQRSEADGANEFCEHGNRHSCFWCAKKYIWSLESQLISTLTYLRERTEEVGRLRRELGEAAEMLRFAANFMAAMGIDDKDRKAAHQKIWNAFGKALDATRPPPAERAAEGGG